MKGLVAEWLEGIREHLLWIDFESYARRVFAGTPRDWYQDPASYVATILEAHVLVQSDVVAIDAMGPYIAALAQDETLSRRCTGLAPVEAVAAMLDAEAPGRFLADVVDALVHRLAGTADLFLKLQSPRELLIAAGAPADEEADFGDLDDVATAMANFLRPLANKPLQGLQVATRQPNGMDADEIEALDPLLGAAAYYGWVRALSFDRYRGGERPDIDVEVLLLPDSPSVHRMELEAGSGHVGGGLSGLFWNGQADVILGKRSLHYGVIPEGVTPESVVARLRTLRSGP